MVIEFSLLLTASFCAHFVVESTVIDLVEMKMERKTEYS